MEGARAVLLLVHGRLAEPSLAGFLDGAIDEREFAAAESRSDVTLQDVVDAARILRVTELASTEHSRYRDAVELRILSGADRSHRSLPIATEVAADLLSSPGALDPDVEARLEAAGLAGQVLLAAATADPDRVDEAAEHPCAVVRVAAAANPVPTQRLYELASDACRDVALVALANERGQQLMTRQFRGALEIAAGYPLAACPCGTRNR